MSRDISTATTGDMNAASTPEVFLTLIEISHPDFDTVRLVNNTVDITSGGDTYTAFPFIAVFPPDTDQINAVGRLSIPNATSEIVEQLRSVLGSLERITVDMHDIKASSPSTHLRSETGLELTNVNYDVDVMTGTLTRNSYVNEPFPGDIMTPGTVPGIF